jgi:hypothetical protein
MTNCKTAYSHCIVLLVNWKCLALQKDEWDSWETEENLLGLRKLEKYFEAVFSNFYFKLAKGKVIFLCICQKKSDQKGHLQLIFLLERNEGRGVGLCSRPSGYYACQLVCKWFILKSRLYTWRNPGMGHQCPLEVSAKRIIFGNQYPAFGRFVHTQAKAVIFNTSSNNCNRKSSY